MGNILIFVILAVTIPRWALTLAQVDKFGIAGIPLAAIGEAIVLEFGVLYILSVFNRCRTHALQYQAEWEALNQRNIEQGKKTRKPPKDARMGGYLVLPIALLVLEILTIASQTPFIAGQLMSESAVTLLNDWGMLAVWGYALLLVISPGIMTVGIGFGIHYENVLRQISGVKDTARKRDIAQEKREIREKKKLEKETQARQEFADSKRGQRRVSRKLTREVMLRDGYACYYCSADMKDWPQEQIHIDHFIPVNEGGADHPMNLVVSCAKCNLSKNARIPSKDEARAFQIHLVKNSDHPAKEKVWILHHCGLQTKQRDIARALKVSPGYVSSSLSELPDELPEHVRSFCEDLTSLGESLTEADELPETSGVIAGHLVKIQERLSHEQQAGRANGVFRRVEVEEWLDLSKAQATNVLNYGLETGVLAMAGQHQYKFAERVVSIGLGTQAHS